MIAVARSCETLDKALTGAVSDRRRKVAVERAKANKLGRLLGCMIRAASDKLEAGEKPRGVEAAFETT